MDSRQFGVLLMAVLSILAPIVKAQVGTDTNSTIAEKPSPMPNETTTLMQNISVTDDKSTTSATKSPSPTESEAETSSTVLPSTVATTLAVVSTTAAASSVNATKHPVTNDHAIRDVASDLEKCSSSFRANLEKNKDNWIPEKAFLGVVGEDSTLTIEKFCEQVQSIVRLNTVCNNTKIPMDAEDDKVAPIVAGLASMFTSVCSDPKIRFNTTVEDSTPCAEFLRLTAKSCSSNPVAKGTHVYPTGVLFEEMTRDNCTVVFNTKECIAKALEQNDKCSPALKNFISDAITKMTKGLPCVLPHSDDAPTSAPATTGPSITTPKTPGNAGTNFQVNFFTVLPIILLAFKFY